MSSPHSIKHTDEASTLSYGSIRAFNRKDTGHFKMSHELFGWKNRRNGIVHQYKATQIEEAVWIPMGTTAQLRIHLRDGGYAIFSGFRENDFEQIKAHFIKYFHVHLKKKKMAGKGWHWGHYRLTDRHFAFDVDGNAAFEVSTSDVSQVTTPSRTDIAMELVQDDTRDAGDDQLLELRFYVPPRPVQEGAGGDVDLVSTLKEEMVQKFGVGETGAESICHLTNIHLLVPRGRYEIALLRTSLRLHGKSIDYTILYRSITRMFLLPKPDGRHVVFVTALETPMRQGQTRYPFVVIQFDDVQTLEVSLNLAALGEGYSKTADDSSPQKDRNQYEDLEPEMKGKQYDVVTRLFKSLVGRSVVVPGNFKSYNGDHCIRCNYKASDGHLYPLNRSFIFIVKPVIFIRYDDITSVEFSRTSGPQTRYFEFRISVKNEVHYDFTSIDRSEYKPLASFLEAKKLRIKNLREQPDLEKPPGEGIGGGEDLPSDEEDDEDFVGAEDEDDEDEEEEGEGSDDEGSVSEEASASED